MLPIRTTLIQHLQFELSVSKPRRESEATNNCNLGLPGVAAFTDVDQSNHGRNGEFAFAM